MPFDEIRQLNQNFLHAITSGDDQLVKYAQEQTNDFIRVRLREEAICRYILPAQPVTPNDYTPQITDDEPAIVVEMEPRSPGAIVMGFGKAVPPAFVFHANRFVVRLHVILSPRLRKPIHQLETYRADIRALLAENIVRDLGYVEDIEFFRMVDLTLNVTGDGRNIFTGEQQSWTISGGVSRTNLAEAKKRTTYPAGRIPVTKAVTNISTLSELEKMERQEIGDDRAADIFFEGWGNRRILGIDVLSTIKREIIPNGVFYMFGDPQFIGKFYVRNEPTIYLKTEDLEVEFYAYEVLGASIGHADAVHRFAFTT